MKDFLQGIDWVALGITGVFGVIVAVVYAMFMEGDLLTAGIIGLIAGLGLPMAYQVGDRVIAFS